MKGAYLQHWGVLRPLCRRAVCRGSATVELALILPVLLTLTLGCADFGRIVYAYIVVSNAARVGAEYGATHRFTTYTYPHWESQLRALVEEEMSHLSDFDPESLSVTVETGGEGNGFMRVSASTSYRFRTAVQWPGIPSELALYRKVSMRQYR